MSIFVCDERAAFDGNAYVRLYLMSEEAARSCAKNETNRIYFFADLVPPLESTQTTVSATVCDQEHGGEHNTATFYGHGGRSDVCVRVGDSNVWVYNLEPFESTQTKHSPEDVTMHAMAPMFLDGKIAYWHHSRLGLNLVPDENSPTKWSIWDGDHQ